MSKAVQKLFTEIAPKYDFLNHCLSLTIDRRWRDRAVGRLKGQKLTRILDLCAGTLDLSQGLLEEFPRAQVVAVDFSLAMLESGRQKVATSMACHLLCADGHSLPLLDESFDAVVCGFGIRNLECRQRAIEEIHRVLKPGGHLLILEFFRPEGGLAKAFYQTYGRFVIPKLGGLISKNPEAYQYLQDSIQRFYSIYEYQALLRDNGFSDVETQKLSGGIAHEILACKSPKIED